MHSQIVNNLLCSLSFGSQNELLQGSRLVRLPRNRTVYEQGERSTHAYFMQTGLASLVVDTSNGEHIEIGMVGHEGVIGMSTLLGPAPNITRCVMQLDSSAFEVSMDTLCRCFENNREIRSKLLEFTQSYLLATERVAACNRVHLAPERLVRWLLIAQTYSQVSQLPFTHEYLAQMVAVQRTTVSLALNSLQAEGLIEHGWGTVLIKDRPGLELKACSCYQIVKKLYMNLYKSD